MKFNKAIPILGLGLSIALGGCADLAVPNLNAPDEENALSEPGDIEALIGSSLNVWWSAIQDVEPTAALSTMADEWTASWGNFGMQDASSEPRVAFNNSSGYTYLGAVEEPWSEVYEAISNANDGLRALENTEGIESAIEVAPARAFAKMVQAMGHAYLATFFDRAFVYRETMDLETTEFELLDYDVVMDSAMVMFDEAIALAEAGDFTLDPSWIGNMSGFTATDLAEFGHAFKARYMVAEARNPAERAAVDWNAVMAEIDAANGQEFRVEADLDNWWEWGKAYIGFTSWARADYRLIGPADQSGEYADWLATPVQDRTPVSITSPDLRVFDPSKDCSVFDAEDYQAPSCGTYFYTWTPQNFRASRGTYHRSNYMINRWEDYSNNYAAWVGADIPVLVTAELDLLMAEALLRTNGPKAEIASLINKTRVANGGLTGVPATASDDDLWGAMIYEKRFETMRTSAEMTFSDMRGWGYLTVGTPVHLPIPATELETLQLPLYSFGGSGDAQWAAEQTNCPVTGPTDASGNNCHIPVLKLY